MVDASLGVVHVNVSKCPVASVSLAQKRTLDAEQLLVLVGAARSLTGAQRLFKCRFIMRGVSGETVFILDNLEMGRFLVLILNFGDAVHAFIDTR